MNKRIILVDEVETTDYAKFIGTGLGNELYTLQDLMQLPIDEMLHKIYLGPTDAAILVGPSPFKFLQQYYHFGIRNEGFVDCTKLSRLSIEGGGFVKCISDVPSVGECEFYMSSEFTEPRVFNITQSIFKTYDESVEYLEFLDTLPLDTPLGLDYEASGLPLDEWFELSGASISTQDYAGYISFTDIRKSSVEEEYNELLKRLGEFLVKRQSNIWCYNIQYEFQVSHRMLGVDLYDLCDSSVFNVLDGNHMRKYSLKWTANKLLGTTVWDVDFDRLGTLLDSMYFEIVGKLKRDKQKILKVTPQNYQDTPEWKEIERLYPNHVIQFEKLINEYWGCPYMNIPSDILGYYCNLDSYYTLRIYLERKHLYSEIAINTFLDNIRLGARLHSTGMYKDERFRLHYKEECEKMMAWGITYCAMSRCSWKMRECSKNMSDIMTYNSICRKLMKEGNFFNGDALLITKYLLTNYLDYLDTTDHGLNEGQLMIDFGPDFAEGFLDIVQKAMVEVKMKTKIDSGIGRKKKILGIISENIKPLLELDSVVLGEKQVELEKFLYYEKAYKEFERIYNTEMKDIKSIPLTLNIFDYIDLPLLEYSEFVSENYFKCKSPIENDKIAEEFTELFKIETSYLAAIFESTQQLQGNEKFYSILGINNINEGFNHFFDEWRDYYERKSRVYTYPDKVFNLAIEYWNESCEKTKNIWTNFDGFTAQAQLFSDIKEQYELYGMKFTNQDTTDNFFFMRKFTLNYLLYKKYSKVLSTYIDGMFFKSDMEVIEDPITKIPIRKALPNEPGAVTKMFARYEINTKSSKRWSSGKYDCHLIK